MKRLSLHIILPLAMALAEVCAGVPAQGRSTLREKPCTFSMKDSLFLEKAAALFPDSTAVDSLMRADSLTLALQKMQLDPAYYKLYLPFTFYKAALMQWSPSRLLKGKYDTPEQNFQTVCQKAYNDSLQAQAERYRKSRKKTRRKPRYARSTRVTSPKSQPLQSIVDSLRAAEMQIKAYKLTLQAQQASKEYYHTCLTGKPPLPEYDNSPYTHFLRGDAFLNAVFYSMYYSEPQVIRKWDYKINALKVYKVKPEDLAEPKVNIAELFRPEPVRPAPRRKIKSAKLIKPSFWNLSASSSLQFSQLYVSDNWYKGGEKNLNLQSNFVFKFNYNNRKKVQWDNTLEIKEGFNTTSSDTLRNIHMNNDLLRYTGKIGLQAISNWYYTISTQFSTQLFNGYPTNSDQRTSGFLAPAYLSVGIGMDYKLNKSKLNLSVVLAPLNYDLKFVKDASIEETQYGIDEGKFAQHTYGSKITSTFDWQIFSFVKYTSRFEGFTNYERTEGSWENTLDFFVNRYIKASLFWHIRFDDNVAREPGESYFQYYELFSFGLTYDW